MRDIDLEHPDITYALKTGYPMWNQPKYFNCCMCGDEITSDEVYEDFGFDCLCENCLLKLHKKVIYYEDL